MMYQAMSDELLKIAQEVTAYEATRALNKLRELEAKKPTGSEIARGALAGGTAGTVASLARSAVSGGLAKSVREAMQAPTIVGKAGRLTSSALSGAGQSMAGSAAFGSTLPFVRGYLDREAEKAKLREYLGVAKGGKVRRKAKRVLGV